MSQKKIKIMQPKLPHSGKLYSHPQLETYLTASFQLEDEATCQREDKHQRVGKQAI